jgi:hypothetical protein
MFTRPGEVNMYIPKTGERVVVNEREAIFTVAHFYHETQTADLVPVGRGQSKKMSLFAETGRG